MRGVVTRLSFIGLALVLAVALIAPIVVFASTTLGTVETDLAARTSAERARAAVQATRVVEQELDAIETDLRLFAARPEIQQGGRFRDAVTMESALAELIDSRRYSFVGIYDGTSSSGIALAGVRLERDGTVRGRRIAVAGFDGTAGTQQRALADLYRQVITPALGNQVVTSAAFLLERQGQVTDRGGSPVTGWVVFVARAVLGPRTVGLRVSEPIGAIVAAPRFEHLSDQLRLLAASGRTVSLLTRDFAGGATLISVASTADEAAGSTVVDIPDRARAFAGEAGEALSREGTERVIAYAPIHSSVRGAPPNWVITVTDELAVTLGPERRLAEQVQAASLTAVGFAGVLAVVLAFLVSLVERQRRALGLSLRENVRLLQEVEEKSAAVDAASQAKSRFLASMSHELRTPLNSIIGFSELLQTGVAGSVTEKQREYLGDVVGSGKHLLTLINDVLDLSKVEAGKLELHPEEVDLAATVEQVAAVMRPLADGKGLELNVDTPADLGLIHLDGGRLRQILLNLASNAVKFTPAGGRVTIAARRLDDDFEVSVRDTGIGLRDADLQTIFEEFRQIDSAYGRSQQGTGLGLALVKRFVELMGGSIAVSSAAGVGSTFVIKLPLRHGIRASVVATP